MPFNYWGGWEGGWQYEDHVYTLQVYPIWDLPVEMQVALTFQQNTSGLWWLCKKYEQTPIFFVGIVLEWVGYMCVSNISLGTPMILEIAALLVCYVICLLVKPDLVR